MEFVVMNLLSLMIFSILLGSFLICGETWISWINHDKDYVGHIIVKKAGCLSISTGVIKAILMIGMAIPMGMAYKSFNE